MPGEIYITIGKHSDDFKRRYIGKTTKWPVKAGAPRDSQVYFLIGNAIIASGRIASDKVTRKRWNGSPKLFREINNVQMLAVPIPREEIREKIPGWGWPRSKQPIQTSVPSEFQLSFEQLTHRPPAESGSKKLASMIVMGGSDEVNEDYTALRAAAESGKPIGPWSCLKNTRHGNEVWFYITRPNSAIVAVGTACSDANRGRKWPYECQVCDVQWLHEPITRSELVTIFPSWAWPRYTRGKVWLTRQQSKRLRDRSGITVQPPPTLHFRLGRGAGFGSPEQNAKVERTAVDYATQLLEGRGFTLKSVERDKIGYDLLARRKNIELHVEVKGVAGTTPEFIITGNEFRHASTDKGFRLIVVINALKIQRRAVELTGNEFLSRYQLDPVAYRAKTK